MTYSNFASAANIDGAIDAYTRAIDLKPEPASAALCYSNRSACYQVKKEWTKMQQDGEALAKLAQINGAIESGKIELQKNLTAPDLLEVACSKEYLDSHGDLLCRELFCRLQTREGDGASQQECESMANISNSLHIIRACGDTIAPDWETCVETFEKRK